MFWHTCIHVVHACIHFQASCYILDWVCGVYTDGDYEVAHKVPCIKLWWPWGLRKGTMLHAKYTFCLFQNHWPWEPQTSDLIYSCKCSSSWFLKCMYMYNHFLMKILGVVGKVPFCQILLIKFVILSFMLGFATIVQLLVRTVMKIAPLKRRRRQGLVCSERERSQLTLPRQLQQRRLEMKTLPQHLSRMEKVSKSFKWVVLGIH